MTLGVMGNGVSGLLSANTALATISQNITNANTDGYTRQRVDLVARNPQATGAGFIGNGVTVAAIERVYDNFLTNQLRLSTSSYNQLARYHDLATQIDNSLSDPSVGLMPILDSFFSAIQEVANDPTSSAARQSMLSSGQTLVDRFHNMDQRLSDLKGSLNNDLKVQVDTVNQLSASIADLNRKIFEAKTLGGGEPNDMLDRRDAMIKRVSEIATTSTVAQADGSVNVFLGTGQAIVTGFDSYKLATVTNSYDPSYMDVSYVTPNGTVDITGQISGGSMGGMLDFRAQVLDRTQDILGHLALGIAQTFNQQHKSGQDLRGNIGQDFFTDLSPASAEVLQRSNNTGSPSPQLSVAITDTNAVVASSYRLDRDSSGYMLTRLFDNTSFTMTSFPATPAVIDGMTITLNSGAINVGDSIIIRPSRSASEKMALNIHDASAIAAANPVRSAASINNNGNGVISNELISNSTLYIPDTYGITAGYMTAAAADGATRGVITDAGNNSTLKYELRINNVLVYTQLEADPPLANLQSLADKINGNLDANVALTGVRAFYDVAAARLYLVNDPQNPVAINVRESLVTTAGVVEDADTATGYFFAGTLTAVSLPAASTDYSGNASNLIFTDGSGAVIGSSAYISGGAVSFSGLSATITGALKSGDKFRIEPNSSGVSDNRNALAMIGLQTRLSLNNGSDSYKDIYGKLVSEAGVYTHQAEVNRDAQEALLNRAVAAREAKSGVNLDEEAANMLHYQQFYQAAAQIIIAAENNFNTLMSIFRG